jgi:Kef-type K+ transport system membrane component KefB
VSDADALIALFALLVAAKTGEELFRRLNQPVVAGQILAGIIVGPSLLNIVDLDDASINHVVSVFAELGVIFLLFWVGLETRLSELLTVGRTAATVGALGVVLPVAAGVGGALVFGETTATSLFLGAALAATSVGITSAILLELDLIDGRAGRTILGAAVIDDVLALIALGVATGISETGSVDVADAMLMIGVAVAFIGFFAFGGSRVLRSWPQALEAPRFADSPLMPAVIICLGLAVLSSEIGLAAVVGAFLAGMIVSETKRQNAIETEVAPLYAFFAPFFFTSIGAQVDLGSLADSETIELLALVTAGAIATKYAGAWLGASALGKRDRRIVAAGMVPRGEVGVIVAGIGYANGVIDPRLFAVVVAMSVLTTLVAPYMIRSAAKPAAASDPA